MGCLADRIRQVARWALHDSQRNLKTKTIVFPGGNLRFFAGVCEAILTAGGVLNFSRRITLTFKLHRSTPVGIVFIPGYVVVDTFMAIDDHGYRALD